MRKLIAAFALAIAPTLAFASGGLHLDKAPIDVSDKASLQHGAKLFVNYCLSCHSANYMRYNRMGADLGLTDDDVKKNLMFAADKVGSPMTIAMTKTDGKAWFGAQPPDLTIIARARGADYLYTYLRGFYLDEKRPFGVNNKVFPDVGMPHVLWELQGLKDAHGKVVRAGSMDEAQFDEAAKDLTNFLVYMGEPMQLERKKIGMWVLGFLAIFFVVSYLLKKEYWKDVH